jgi:ABC-type antimicrobial peptide transport system permease subunit
MLETLFIVLLGIGIGFVIGMLLLARAIKKTLDKEQAESIQELADRITNQLVFLRVEQDSNLFLAYDAVSGDFVCQGSTMEDLNVNFGKRYPTKKGILVEPEKGEARELV